MKKIISISIIIIAIIILGYISFMYFFPSNKGQTSTTLNDILQLQQTQITSFDPLDAYHIGHVQIVKQLYNTLTDIDENANIIPSIAESWSTKDGKEWEINIRKGVKFINDDCFENKLGRELTANDVKFTFYRLLDSASTSLGKGFFKNIVGVSEYQLKNSIDISGIKVNNDYSIGFTLITADYNFYKNLSLCYASIVPKEAIEKYKEQFKFHPVGTGPFKLLKFDKDKSVQFIKNSTYWEKHNGQQMPFVDTLNLELLTDDNFALSQFKSGKSDFLELTLPQYYQVKDNPNMKIDSKVNATLQFYLFNLDKLKEPDYRKAISYAIDRNKLQNTIGNLGKVTSSIFPSSIFSYLDSKESLLNFDLNKAQNDIKKGPKELKLVCFDDILSRNIAQLIQNSLKDLNVKVNIESVPFSVLVDKLIKGDYDMIQLYWGPYYADVLHYLSPFLTTSIPPAGNNFNKYSNAKFDELVNLASSQRDSKDTFLESEKVILNDMPFLILYFSNSLRVTDGKFNFPLNPLQYRLYKFAEPNK